MEKNDIQKWLDLYEDSINLENDEKSKIKYTNISNDLHKRLSDLKSKYDADIQSIENLDKEHSALLKLEETFVKVSNDIADNPYVIYLADLPYSMDGVSEIGKIKIEKIKEIRGKLKEKRETDKTNELKNIKEKFIYKFDNLKQYPESEYNDDHWKMVGKEYGFQQMVEEKKKVEDGKKENDFICNLQEYQDILNLFPSIEAIYQEYQEKISQDDETQDKKLIEYDKHEKTKRNIIHKFCYKMADKVFKFFTKHNAMGGVLIGLGIFLLPALIMGLVEGAFYGYLILIILIACIVCAIISAIFIREVNSDVNKRKDFIVKQDQERRERIHRYNTEFQTDIKENIETILESVNNKKSLAYQTYCDAKDQIDENYNNTSAQIHDELDEAKSKYEKELLSKKNSLLSEIPENIRGIFNKVEKLYGKDQEKRKDFIVDARVATDAQGILNVYYNCEKIVNDEKFQNEKLRMLEQQALEQRMAQEEQNRILEEQASDQRRAQEQQNRILEEQAREQRKEREKQERLQRQQAMAAQNMCASCAQYPCRMRHTLTGPCPAYRKK